MKRRRPLPYNWNPLLQGELRRLERAARLGPDPECVSCGERALAVLEPTADGVRCYACRVDPSGDRRDVELDHPLGRARAPDHVVAVPANLNQLFNDADDGPEARLRWLLRPSERVLRLLRRR